MPGMLAANGAANTAHCSCVSARELMSQASFGPRAWCLRMTRPAARTTVDLDLAERKPLAGLLHLALPLVATHDHVDDLGAPGLQPHAAGQRVIDVAVDTRPPSGGNALTSRHS
jgi:hypothetical protein